VDVFVGGDKAKLPRFYFLLDLAKTALNRARLGAPNQANARQHAGVGYGTKDVVPIEAAVERQRRGESLDFGQTPARDPAPNKIGAPGCLPFPAPAPASSTGCPGSEPRSREIAAL